MNVGPGLTSKYFSISKNLARFIYELDAFLLAIQFWTDIGKQRSYLQIFSVCIS